MKTTDQPEHKRSARLLSALLATTIALCFVSVVLPGMLGMDSGWRDEGTFIFTVLVIVSALLHYLSQRYSYKLAALLLILLLIVVITVSSYPNVDLWELDTLMYLALPVLVSSAFLGIRPTLAIMIVTLLMPLLIAVQVPAVPLIDIVVAPFSFLLVVNTLVVVVANHRDQIERDRLRQIAENERLLRTITENVEEAILYIDADGIIQYASPSHQALVGDSAANLKYASVYAETFLNRTHPDDQGIVAEFLRAPASSNTSRLSTRIRHADGHYLWLETSISRLHDPNGKLMGVIVVSRDITARREAEAANREREMLAVALAKERELGEIRSLFMRTVSHEFRTPLATILMAADILDKYADRVSPERRAESGAVIRREIRRLEQMLRDMMDILRIQDQHLALDPQPINLEQFFDDIVNDFRRAAPDNPITLEINMSEGAARGDVRLLRYIVSNLLGNAIKYSPPNRPVAVQVEQDGGSIRLNIRDQGIGIKPEDQQRLFEPFYRGSNVNEISGSGLGLKIVHDCVHLYQGSISFESAVGSGTTFTVILPLL